MHEFNWVLRFLGLLSYMTVFKYRKRKKLKIKEEREREKRGTERGRKEGSKEPNWLSANAL